MKNFIENYLKINNYEINYFTNWRNNITCLVIFWDKKIIIQKENIDFPENQKYLINKIISESENTDLNLAWNYLENRFIKFEWGFYQVMNYIKSINLDENSLDEKSILSMFKYLANFHNFSENLNIEENKKNIWKTFKSVDELIWESKILNSKNNNYQKYFDKILEIKNTLNIIEIEKSDLRKWIIHWDPAFKNFVFNNKKEALSLIDYEKVEYNNFNWDLADLIRSLMKVDYFDNNLLKKSISEYEKYRILEKNEKIYLINYLETLILHVILQYYIALFPEGSVNNMIWNNDDTIKKLERGFWELKKNENWII